VLAVPVERSALSENSMTAASMERHMVLSMGFSRVPTRFLF